MVHGLEKEKERKNTGTDRWNCAQYGSLHAASVSIYDWGQAGGWKLRGPALCSMSYVAYDQNLL